LTGALEADIRAAHEHALSHARAARE